MADLPKPRTHTAYTPQRVGKKLGRWLEVGSGRIDAEGVDLFIDRLPVGGFTGFVRLIRPELTKCFSDTHKRTERERSCAVIQESRRNFGWPPRMDVCRQTCVFRQAADKRVRRRLCRPEYVR